MAGQNSSAIDNTSGSSWNYSGRSCPDPTKGAAPPGPRIPGLLRRCSVCQQPSHGSATSRDRGDTTRPRVVVNTRADEANWMRSIVLTQRSAAMTRTGWGDTLVLPVKASSTAL
jgi:hypothetical protein